MIFSHSIVSRNYKFIDDTLHNSLLKEFGYFMKDMMELHHQWLHWPIVENNDGTIILYMRECYDCLEDFCEENNLKFVSKRYFNEDLEGLGCIYKIKRL